MREVDAILEDDELLSAVFEAQGQRHKESCRLGRHQTPAEVVLRMLLLKHVRNWSYEVLEREARANLVYRSFCRIGMEKVPDAKTLVRLGQTVGPEVIAELHARIVALAQARGIVQGRKMRVDTTVVETNVHHPTDSSLLGDGARVLTRTKKEGGGPEAWRLEDEASGPDANGETSCDGGRIGCAADGAARGRAQESGVSSAGERNAQDCQSGRPRHR
jgi:IS5 family transposase